MGLDAPCSLSLFLLKYESHELKRIISFSRHGKRFPFPGGSKDNFLQEVS